MWYQPWLDGMAGTCKIFVRACQRESVLIWNLEGNLRNFIVGLYTPKLSGMICFLLCPWCRWINSLGLGNHVSIVEVCHHWFRSLPGKNKIKQKKPQETLLTLSSVKPLKVKCREPWWFVTRWHDGLDTSHCLTACGTKTTSLASGFWQSDPWHIVTPQIFLLEAPFTNIV